MTIDDLKDNIGCFGVGILVILISVLCVYGIVKRNEWLNLHCQKIGQVAGSNGISTTFDGDGNMHFGTVYIPGKNGYKCDDGLTYWE